MNEINSSFFTREKLNLIRDLIYEKISEGSNPKFDRECVYCCQNIFFINFLEIFFYLKSERSYLNHPRNNALQCKYLK